MMMKNVFIALIAVCLVGIASAQAPSLISYQGKLMDDNGVPVTGTHSLQFDIYTSPTGGTPLWSETHPSVTITAGLFNVTLGETTALSAGLFDINPELWLEVTLNGSETFDRTRLISVPFSILSQNSDLLAGIGASQFLRADANATYSGGMLEVAGGSTFNVAGAFQLGGAAVSATAAQLNELVGGGATTLHSHAPGDADTLDSLDSTQFLRADTGATYSGATLQVAGGSTLNVAGTFQLGGVAVSATAAQLNELVGGGATVLHSHAAGDADTLDALDSTQFLRSDVDDTCAGVITFTGTVKGGYQTDKGIIYITPAGVTPGSNDTMFGIFNTNTSNPDGWDIMVFGEGGALTVNGPFQGGCKWVEQGYNRFGNSVGPNSGEIMDNNDVLISDDLEVQGDLIWGTKTSYFSINSSDFLHADDAYTFTRGRYGLVKASGDLTAQDWYAPVHIPHGAIVTSFTIWYWDSSAGANITVMLNRKQRMASSYGTMASVSTSGSGGWGSATDTTITGATIDNDNWAYFVDFTFPAADTGTTLQFREARITYTTTGP